METPEKEVQTRNIEIGEDGTLIGVTFVGDLSPERQTIIGQLITLLEKYPERSMYMHLHIINETALALVPDGKWDTPDDQIISEAIKRLIS